MRVARHEQAALVMQAKLRALQCDSLTQSQYVNVFMKQSERPEMHDGDKPKDKPKDKEGGGVDSVLPPATAEWPQDDAVLQSLLRNLPDMEGAEGERRFIEYTDAVRDYARGLPGGLCDIQHDYVDTQERQLGLFWAVVCIGIRHRRQAILRARLPQGAGFPTVGALGARSAGTRDRRWEIHFAEAEYVLAKGGMLPWRNTQPATEHLGTWLRHQTQKDWPQGSPELQRLQQLEPAGLFLDRDA
eukprot:gene11263-1943_t